jgi:hypothetical protein
MRYSDYSEGKVGDDLVPEFLTVNSPSNKEILNVF